MTVIALMSTISMNNPPGPNANKAALKNLGILF